MRELWLLRHAKSDWRQPVGDFDRPLRKRGKKAADKMGLWAKTNLSAPDRLISSPALRARQTVVRFAKAMGISAQTIRFEPRLYLGDVEDLIKLAIEQGKCAKRLLLVGHNPDFDDLLYAMCKRPPAYGDDGKLMPTATLAVVQFDHSIAARAGTLLLLQRPKLLSAT